MSRALLLLLAAGLLGTAPRAAGQTADHPPAWVGPAPMNDLVDGSEAIALLEVRRVDPATNLIVFRPVANLKGRGPVGDVRHLLADRSPWDVSDCLAWARPGKQAVCFCNRNTMTVCLGNCWYESERQEAGDWAVEAIEAAPRGVFAGRPARLAQHVRDLLAGREVTITARTDDLADFELFQSVRLDWVHGQKGRVCQLRLKPVPSTRAGAAESPLEGWPEPGRFVAWGTGGPEVVAPLIGELKAKDEHTRAEAAVDLGLAGPHARSALPALRRACRDSDPFVRIHAAEAVTRLDMDKPAPLKPIRDALRHRDANVRLAAASALTRLGPRTRPVVPALVMALQDPKEEVRQQCAFALREAGIAANAPAGERAAATQVMGVALKGERFLPVRLALVEALLRLGADAGAAVPALGEALRDEDRTVARVAVEVLARLDPPAILVLTQALDNPECQVVPEIQSVLGDLGPRAWLAIPALKRQLAERNDADCLRTAAEALLLIEGKRAHTEVVTALGRALRDGSEGEREAALRVVNERRIKIAGLVDDLRLAARLGKDAVGLAAAEALGRAGHAREAAAVLVRALEVGADSTRADAAAVLGRLGPAARNTLPTLRKLARNSDDPAHAHLVLALRLVEGGGADRGERGERIRAAVLLAEMKARVAHPMLMDEAGIRILPLGDLAEEAARLETLIDRAVLLLASDGPVIPCLTRALQCEDPFERLVAGMVLFRLGWKQESLPVLLRLLEERPYWFWHLADTLAEAGPAARPALALVLRALTHPDRLMYLAARRIAVKIDPEAVQRVWGVKKLAARSRAPLRLSRDQMNACWTALSGERPAEAYQAAWQLILSRELAVSFLAGRLRLAASPRPGQLVHLVADLENRSFAVRRSAEAELEAFGQLAEPVLREVLAGQPSLEVRRRVEGLLARLDPVHSPGQGRLFLSVQVLESVGSSAAKDLLKSLAGGDSKALLTREAKAALRRRAGTRTAPRSGAPAPG